MMASPQLKNAKHTTNSAMSWMTVLETFELMRNGTPPATVFAESLRPRRDGEQQCPDQHKAGHPAVRSDEMIARGTRLDAWTTSSATSPANSNP